jgi:hypothetical protein
MVHTGIAAASTSTPTPNRSYEELDSKVGSVAIHRQLLRTHPLVPVVDSYGWHGNGRQYGPRTANAPNYGGLHGAGPMRSCTVRDH